MTYEEAQAQMPPGWFLWGNFGDGKWRAGPPQENRIIPQGDISQALAAATRAYAEDKA